MNYFIEVLKKYAQFSGRSRRKEYWYFFLFNLIIAIVLQMICTAIGNHILYSLYCLAVLIPGIAVGVRRMHDVGKSGWFILIPIYNIILACTNGNFGPNEYGPDPKGGEGFGATDYEKPYQINES